LVPEQNPRPHVGDDGATPVHPARVQGTGVCSVAVWIRRVVLWKTRGRPANRRRPSLPAPADVPFWSVPPAGKISSQMSAKSAVGVQLDLSGPVGQADGGWSRKSVPTSSRPEPGRDRDAARLFWKPAGSRSRATGLGLPAVEARRRPSTWVMTSRNPRPLDQRYSSPQQSPSARRGNSSLSGSVPVLEYALDDQDESGQVRGVRCSPLHPGVAVNSAVTAGGSTAICTGAAQRKSVPRVRHPERCRRSCRCRDRTSLSRGNHVAGISSRRGLESPSRARPPARRPIGQHLQKYWLSDQR